MKKTVSCIIALMLFLFAVSSVLTVGSLADFEISRDDAVALINEAVDLRHNIGGDLFCGFDWENTEVRHLERTVYGFRRVAEGYSLEELKRRVDNTFVSKTAEDIKNHLSFDADYNYETIDDEVFYIFFNYNDSVYRETRTSVWFEPEEVSEKIELIKSGGRQYAVVPAHKQIKAHDMSTNLTPVEGYNRVSDFDVLVYFENENGSWKISDVDFSNMIFMYDDNEDLKGDLTVDIAKKLITASVYELYYYTRFEPAVHLHTGGMDCGPFEMVNNRLNVMRMEGNLRDFSTWEAYATEFCTKDISEKILKFDTAAGLIIRDGSITRSSRTDNISYEIDFEFGDWDYPQTSALRDIADSIISVNLTNENEATVLYKFMSFNNGFCSDVYREEVLSFELTKTDGSWKISGGDFVEKLDSLYESKYPDMETNGWSKLVQRDNPGTGINDDVMGSFPGVVLLFSLVLIVLRRRENRL